MGHVILDIGHTSYDNEFHIDLDSFEQARTVCHARMDILFVLHGSIHVETPHTRFDMRADDFCVFNPMELYSVDIDSDAHVLRYSIADSLLGGCNVRVACTSMDPRFGNDMYEHLRYHLARIFQYYYKDAEYNRAIIFSLIYGLLDTLLKYFSVVNPQFEAVPGQRESLEKILAYILTEYPQSIRLDTLAARFFLSPGYISRLFQQHLGVSFSQYLRTVRLSNAYHQLRTTSKSVTTIAMDTGFGSTTQLIEAFKRHYGVTPGKLRKERAVPKKPRKGLDPHIFDTLLSHTTLFLQPVVHARREERITFRVEQPLGGRRFKPGFFKLINVGFAKEILYAPIQEQLRTCQEEIGFEYIRFHGIFDEDMMVYRVDKNGKIIYNFTYIDMVYDFILSIGLKPYVEFSYYPSALAADPRQDFRKGSYLRGLPNSMDNWCELVRQTIRHWIERYGLQAVRSWWFRTGEAHSMYYKRMSFEEYMYLYTETCRAVKQVDPSLQFGGMNLDIGMLQEEGQPDIEEYLSALRKAGFLPDFYSFQCFHNVYDSDWFNTLEAVSYHESEPATLSEDADYLSNRMGRLRRIIRSFDPRNKSIILDTWNSTIWQRDLRNDTCFKSAFLFKNMLENAETISAFGYWVLSDLYEEVHASRQLFHGGYGLITRNGIPKAAYNAFLLLRMLGERFVQRGDGYYVTCNADGEVQVALYNYCHYDNLSRQHIFVEGNDLNRYEMYRDSISREISMKLSLPDDSYIVRRYGIARGNAMGSAYDTWLEMASPKELDALEVDRLRSISGPSFRKYKVKAENGLVLRESLEPHEVCVLLIRPAVQTETA